jgi:hypothetical protein
MKVLLIDFDGKIPNLALMKLSSLFKAEGHQVGFDIQEPDMVKVSVVFRKNRAQAQGLTTMFPGATVDFGGPGMFPDCGSIREAEFLKPDYELYPSEYSQGFTTRGCVRKCPFCIVPRMEGKITPWQHPELFHDDQFDTCMLMDNNLLAAGQWAHGVLRWFIDQEIKILSHGWDARLLTEETAGLLREVKHKKGLTFAWDNMGDEAAVFRAISLLKAAGFKLKREVSFYILCGFNTTFEEDLYRCNRLREAGVNSFVMLYHRGDPLRNRLAKWANRRWAYWSAPFPR